MTRIRMCMALCALVALAACGSKSPTAASKDEPKPIIKTVMVAKASATAYAACNSGSSKAVASAYSEASAAVTGTGSTQAAADEDAQAQYDAVLAQLDKQVHVEAQAKAIAICETGGVPSPGPGPTPPGPGPNPPNPPNPPPPNPPPSGDVYEISFTPHGGEGFVGTSVGLTAKCKKNGSEVSPCSPNWSTQYTDRVAIIGPNVGQATTIKYISPFSSVIAATWNGASDSATFTGKAEVLQPKCTAFYATPTSTPVGLEVLITWRSENSDRVSGSGDWTRASLVPNDSEKINPTKNPTILNLTCASSRPGTTPDTVSLSIEVTQPVCPSSVDYTPAGGSIGVNQTKNLTATSRTAPCNKEYWGVDIPDRCSLAGASGVEVRDDVAYPVGDIAVLKRIAKGTCQGFVQPSLVNTNKTWHTWTDATSAALVAESDDIPPGVIMFTPVRDAGGNITGYTYTDPKTRQVFPVAQTGAPQR